MSAGQFGIVLRAGSPAPLAAELPALLRAWCPRRDGLRPPGSSRLPDGTCSSSARTACLSQAKNQAASPVAADPVDWADVQASLGGDEEAYARLVHRHQQSIAAYMWRFTRDRTCWEELVHDVFVEAYFALAGYKGRAPLLHWLKRIATRVGYRYWKHRGRRAHEMPLTDETLDAVPWSDRDESARQAAELVHQLLARLAYRDRLVMTLMYLEENSVAQIAELTGWSESMVKVQAHRARRRLKKICDNMGIEL